MDNVLLRTLYLGALDKTSQIPRCVRPLASQVVAGVT